MLEVTLYELPSDESDPRLDETTLSPDEKLQSNKIRHRPTQLMHIFSRNILRNLLSETLEINRKEVTYKTNLNGKPSLNITGAPSLFFNISHSKNQLLVGLSSDFEIGVDIQHHEKRTSRQELAKRFFSEKEYAILSSAEPVFQTEHFYSIWAQKEAFIKAIGLGLQMPLDCFSTQLNGLAPYILKNISHPQFRDETWIVQSLALPIFNFSAAVSWKGSDLQPITIQQKKS